MTLCCPGDVRNFQPSLNALRCASTGLSATELTAQNLDKSKLLEDTIARQRGGNAEELLAEFELAFAAFLYGQSLEGAQAFDELVPE